MPPEWETIKAEALAAWRERTLALVLAQRAGQRAIQADRQARRRRASYATLHAMEALAGARQRWEEQASIVLMSAGAMDALCADWYLVLDGEIERITVTTAHNSPGCTHLEISAGLSSTLSQRERDGDRRPR